MVKLQIGNILNIDRGFIFHQVNTDGVMGGLAGQIKHKWPVEVLNYIEACRNYQLSVGEYITSNINDGLTIVHIAGQIHPGANTDLKAVEKAFNQFRIDYRGDLSQEYFPYMMGCGMGGGNWDEYFELIEIYFPDAIIVARQEDLDRYGYK